MYLSVGSLVKMESANSTDKTSMSATARKDGADQPAVTMSTNVDKEFWIYILAAKKLLCATMVSVKIRREATSANVILDIEEKTVGGGRAVL